MENRKKILYVASTSDHLAQFHMPYITALKKDFDVYTMANGANVDFPVPFRKKMLSFSHISEIRSIRRILRTEKFDAVILNTTLAAALVRIACKKIKPCPTILNIVHGYLFSYPPKGLRNRVLFEIEKRFWEKTNSICTMNAQDFSAAVENKLCKGKVFQICGMGITPMPASVDQTDMRSLLATREDFLLTYVGELSKRKNQIFLIEALGKLRANGIPAKLLLVGSGSCEQLLRKKTKKMQLEGNVLFAGKKKDVYPYLLATDVYVSASKSEGLPFNILEAMQCGLPILASNVRGQADLLPQQNLYPLGDLQAFCEKAIAIYQSARYGAGSNQYNNLSRYLLQEVFEENLDTIRKGIRL